VADHEKLPDPPGRRLCRLVIEQADACCSKREVVMIFYGCDRAAVRVLLPFFSSIRKLPLSDDDEEPLYRVIE